MSFGTGMKQVTLALATALLATAALAADVPKPAPDAAVDKTEKMVKDALPVCGAETKITTNEMQHKLPPKLAKSKPICAHRTLAEALNRL